MDQNEKESKSVCAEGNVVLLVPSVGGESLSPNAYLKRAREFARAADVLDLHLPDSPEARHLLSAYAVELGLKAFLLHCGKSENDLKGIGHDLRRAWLEAVKHGLPLEREVPHWCELLADCHDVVDAQHKHHFPDRYPEGSSALVFPSSEKLRQNLNVVLDCVEKVVSSPHG